MKIKIRGQLNKTLPPAFLLVAAFLLSAILSYGQETKKDTVKTLPDGTEGLVFTPRPIGK